MCGRRAGDGARSILHLIASDELRSGICSNQHLISPHLPPAPPPSLQHNLARGARKWMEKLVGKSNAGEGSKKTRDAGLDETPFHYGVRLGGLSAVCLIISHSCMYAANKDSCWPEMRRGLKLFPSGWFPTTLQDKGALSGYDLVRLAACSQ